MRPGAHEWDTPDLKLTEELETRLVRDREIDERGVGREAPEPAKRLFAGRERASHKTPGFVQRTREIKPQCRLGFNKKIQRQAG